MCFIIRHYCFFTYITEIITTIYPEVVAVSFATCPALAVLLAVQHGATMPQLRITHYVTAVFIFGVFDKGKKKLLFQNTYVYVCDHRVILFYFQKKRTLGSVMQNLLKETKNQPGHFD